MRPFRENAAPKNRKKSKRHNSPALSFISANDSDYQDTCSDDIDDDNEVLPNNQLANQLERLSRSMTRHTSANRNHSGNDNRTKNRPRTAQPRERQQPQPNGNKRKREVDDTSTIQIQRSINMNQITTEKSTRSQLKALIQQQGDKELSVRTSTICLNLNDHNENYEKTIKLIKKHWTDEKHKSTPNYFRDKENMYITFENRNEKLTFLKWSKEDKQTKMEPLDSLIKATGDKINDFQRKPVRFEIANISIRLVNTDKLGKHLRDILITHNGAFDNYKVGQPYNKGKQRSVYFTTDEVGTNRIINDLGGEINYISDIETETIAMKLNARIPCQPWLCNGCLEYKNHRISECKIRKCNRCGWEGHQAKDCSGIAFCRSCRKTGHKTRDKHCPIYIKQTIKELRKMQIPIDLYKEHPEKLMSNIKNY